MGGKGNEGVAAYVQRIKGSIGYVEYAYAKKNNLALHPGAEQGRPISAAGQRDVPGGSRVRGLVACASGFYQIITNSPGKDSWPIAATSFILLHTTQDKPQNAMAVMQFFDWSFKNGNKMAEELDYVPLPDSLTKLIATAWKSQIKDASGKPVWN